MPPRRASREGPIRIRAAEARAWLAAEAECRTIGVRRDGWSQADYDSVSRRDEAWDAKRVAFDDARTVALVPGLGDYGKRLLRESFWESDEFDRMFKERRLLAIKSAKFRLAKKDPFGGEKPDETESRRGLGLDPWEEKLLGRRAVRNQRKREEREKILAYQKTASRGGADWDDVYEAVAAKAASPTSGAYRLSHQAATAAAELAKKEHEQLWANSGSFNELFAGSFRRQRSEDHYATPARAKRRSSSRWQARTRVSTAPSLDEIEHVVGSTRHPGVRRHAHDDDSSHGGDSSYGDDDFHYMIRADSLNDFDAASMASSPASSPRAL